MPNELKLPSILDDNVDAFSVSAMHISEKLHRRRLSSGISFILKKIILVSLFPFRRKYNYPRVLGLSLYFEAKSILLLNGILQQLFRIVMMNLHSIGRITSVISECDGENHV